VNAARLTSGKEFSSWPTATMQDGKQGGITPFQAKGGNHTNLLHVAAINEEQKNWPTVCASEVRQDFQDRSRGMKGSQESLTTAVVKDAANWRTPTAEALGTGKHMDSADLKLGARVYNKNGKLMAIDLNRQVEIVARQHGQAAPASSSSHGSRQGWSTPTATDASAMSPEMRPSRLATGRTTEYLARQVQWATPKASDPQHSGPNMRDSAGNYALPAQVTKQWGTPAANDANKTPHCEVNSNQAGLAKSVGLELQRQWGAPTARDHKSGRGNEDRQYKELTPMVERQQSGKLNPRWVETLMGLPIGWTMPSCTSPQTIAPMSCDSSAMESCQPPQSELSECLLAS
jgi:hypothetical protein